jgi:hypothetical protein
MDSRMQDHASIGRELEIITFLHFTCMRICNSNGSDMPAGYRVCATCMCACSYELSAESCYVKLSSSSKREAIVVVCCYSPDLQSPISLNNGHV